MFYVTRLSKIKPKSIRTNRLDAHASGDSTLGTVLPPTAAGATGDRKGPSAAAAELGLRARERPAV